MRKYVTSREVVCAMEELNKVYDDKVEDIIEIE